MLAGHSDGRWLDTYVHDFSARFAQPSGFVHGAYGHRWRHNFILWDAGHDQLREAARILREDRTSRQVVVSMWDPYRDLGRQDIRDRPCNTHMYFRQRRLGEQWVLDMTVCCRSNDIVWGCYGSNAVHFSVVLEYVAALVGARTGKMYQVSNNWHGYTAVLDKIRERGPLLRANLYRDGVVGHLPLFRSESVDSVYEECDAWTRATTTYSSADNPQLFDHLLTPMARAHEAAAAGDYSAAYGLLQLVHHPDWRLACEQWVDWRQERAADVRRETVVGVDETEISSGTQEDISLQPADGGVEVQG